MRTCRECGDDAICTLARARGAFHGRRSAKSALYEIGPGVDDPPESAPDAKRRPFDLSTDRGASDRRNVADCDRAPPAAITIIDACQRPDYIVIPIRIYNDSRVDGPALSSRGITVVASSLPISIYISRGPMELHVKVKVGRSVAGAWRSPPRGHHVPPSEQEATDFGAVGAIA
ncbi:unnamed protein product, partial [Iphiclides podalirius]